jgi:ribosomal protein S18 acetylase RimI-like enzyme
MRPLRVADVSDTARGLADALTDDPAWRWLLPDGSTRTRRLERLFASALRGLFLRRGVSHIAAGGNGGALWTDPAGHDPTVGESMRLVPPMAAALGLRTIAGIRLLRGIEHFRPRTPHYYLAVLGVAPAAQGHGIGARLVTPMLARCDSEGVDAYLESTNPKNHGFYRRLGFVEVGHATVVGGVDCTFFSRRAIQRS